MKPEKRVIVIPPTEDKNKTIHQRGLRVAAYCRVSTSSEEHLNSYKSQIEHYTAMIEENPNWVNVGIFADEGPPGVSKIDAAWPTQ